MMLLVTVQKKLKKIYKPIKFLLQSRPTLKDLPTTWRPPHPSFSPYDPALASFFYSGG